MKKTNADILQEKLRESRIPYNSDREFAEAVGVKESTMYKWLKGTPVWPDEPNLRVIADYYGISVDELVSDVSPKSESLTETWHGKSPSFREGMCRVP